MLKRQYEQLGLKNTAAFEDDVCAQKDKGGFDWIDTPEKYVLWKWLTLNIERLMELLLLVYRNRIKPQRKLIFVYETGVRLFNAQYNT